VLDITEVNAFTRTDSMTTEDFLEKFFSVRPSVTKLYFEAVSSIETLFRRITRWRTSRVSFPRGKSDEQEELRELSDILLAVAGDVASAFARTPYAVLGLGLAGHDDRTESLSGLSFHSLNSAILAVRQIGEMTADAKLCLQMALAGLLHDVGKLDIPKTFLEDGSSSSTETHPSRGEAVLRKLGFPDATILKGVRGHHEQPNGGGYPDRLKGDDVSLLASTIAVSSAYDNMTRTSSGRWGKSPREAVTFFINGAGSRYSPCAVKSFIRCFGYYPPGTVIRLSDGRPGVVLRYGEKDAGVLRPQIGVTSRSKEGTVLIQSVVDLTAPKNRSLFIRDIFRGPHYAKLLGPLASRPLASNE
jgi:putative nucleotidyltransferase with HDIG domain